MYLVIIAQMVVVDRKFEEKYPKSFIFFLTHKNTIADLIINWSKFHLYKKADSVLL